MGAEDWMMLQYFDGDKYDKALCDGKARQVWISVRCEEGSEKPSLKLIEEPATYKTGLYFVCVGLSGTGRFFTGLIRSEKVRKNLDYLSKVRKSQKKSEKVRK